MSHQEVFFVPHILSLLCVIHDVNCTEQPNLCLVGKISLPVCYFHWSVCEFLLEVVATARCLTPSILPPPRKVRSCKVASCGLVCEFDICIVIKVLNCSNVLCVLSSKKLVNYDISVRPFN